jgi:hypothetical protein
LAGGDYDTLAGIFLKLPFAARLSDVLDTGTA